MSRLLRTAATASMVSSARLNRAARQSIQNSTPTQAAPASTTQDPVSTPAQSDLAAQLTELNNLKNQGILTEEEFQAKKAKILGI